MKIVPAALEKRMLFHVQHDVEIAVRTALDSSLAESGKANSSFVLDARGNFGVNYLLLNRPAFAFALGARIADHASSALARWASARNTEKTLLIAHLAAASATAAGGGVLPCALPEPWQDSHSRAAGR